MKVSTYTITESLRKWIFESADFGIILTDTDLKITDVNRWIENHSGKKRITLTGNSILESFPEIVDRGLDYYLSDALNGASVVIPPGHHSYLIKFRSNGSDQDYMKQNVKISPLLTRTHKSGLIIRIEDVTERLNREELLQSKNEELQKLNSTKDKFFTIISHDLRSPFNSLIGLSEILMEDNVLSYEEIKKIGTIINISLKNEYSLLENLLKWSQLQSGRFEINYNKVMFAEIIKSILNIATPLTRSKNIEIITKDIAEDLSIHTDPHALTTILHNIVINALKYSIPGGKVKIDAFRSTENIIISVQDNGIGIPGEKLNKLFRIDEIASTPGTENEKGSGLGLILVKELLHKLRGEIWVKSAPGKGSIFYISLPVGNI